MLKFSVVTPSYNQATYLPQTIASVLEQNYPNLEYLVIDGGSTDGTVEILRHYHLSQLRWWSEADNGQAEAINKGFKRTTGEIISWLNSDDVYLPQSFARVSKFFEQNPQVRAVYGDYQVIDGRGKLLLRKQEIPFDYNILLYGLDYISQPTVFFRREILAQCGYLDETLHYGLDWEYWLRLAKYGVIFAHLSHDLAATRWHGQAKTLLAPPAMYAEHAAIQQRYWGKYCFKSAILQQFYAASLNKYYRLKRQLLKLWHGRRLDFPPGHWVMREHEIDEKGEGRER
jgi:glycosyltransferase involved in cell wall biosynthesis